MSKFIAKKFNSICEKLSDDDKRISTQFILVYCIFAVVSAVMTIMNIISGFNVLMYTTLAFAVLNVVNFLLSEFSERIEKAMRVVFAVESIAMFTSFLLVGEPEGFSIIWCALLPVGGMLLYQRKWGSIISLVMFVILAIFFWLPAGKNVLPTYINELGEEVCCYTNSFMNRFPVLYLCFMSVGLVFESIRSYTQKQLNVSREKYKYLSYFDKLTQVSNAAAYLERVDDIDSQIALGEELEFGVISIDLNLLKETNDHFGHDSGNQLIIRIAEAIKSNFKNSEIYRYGGDEFCVIAFDDDYLDLEQKVNSFASQYGYSKFDYCDKELVLSSAIGYSRYVKGDDTFKEVFERADKEMYRCKDKLKEKYKLKFDSKFNISL